MADMRVFEASVSVADAETRRAWTAHSTPCVIVDDGETESGPAIFFTVSAPSPEIAQSIVDAEIAKRGLGVTAQVVEPTEDDGLLWSAPRYRIREARERAVTEAQIRAVREHGAARFDTWMTMACDAALKGGRDCSDWKQLASMLVDAEDEAREEHAERCGETTAVQS